MRQLEGKRRLPLHHRLVITAALGVCLAGCFPTQTGYTGVRQGARLAVVGHSIPNSAYDGLQARLGTTRQVAFDTAPGRRLSEADQALDWAVTSTAAIAVVHLGANDILELSPAQLRDGTARALDRLAGVPCVVWVDSLDRDRAVAPTWQARAQQFNAGLQAEIDARENAHIARWSDAVREQSDWLLSDGLHLSELGETECAVFVSVEVDRLCGGPTTSPPEDPHTSPAARSAPG